MMLGGKRPHLSPLDWGPEERKNLRKCIQDAGLEAVYLAAYNNFTGDAEHSEVPAAELQIAYIEELARLTSDLGGDLVRVFTGYEHASLTYLDQWNRVVEAIKECSIRAAEHGVRIGVQNHHDLGVDWRAQTDLIQAVDEPNCVALFDAWAPALQGVDIAEAARAMAPLVGHTTIADYQLRPRFRYEPEVINYKRETPFAQAVPMGEGFIDYRGFLGALRDGGYNGTVAYEMCSPILGGGSEENLDRYARRFLEYLEKV